jgi:hypothetical protein
MVDVPSLQFSHIRGGSLDEVTELSRGEFGQVGDSGVEVENTELLSGNFGQVGDFGFKKAVMSEDDLHILARVVDDDDGALEMTGMDVWVWFQLVGGGCSCQLLIGRSGVVDKFICLDSNITWNIAWAKVSNAEGYPFGLDWDPGPNKLKIQDVSPGFVWEEGYIKPAGELEMHPEKERNLVDEKVPEVTTRGSVTSPKRVELAEEPPPPECAAFVKYLVSVTKFSYPKGGVELSRRLLSECGLVFKMVNFTVEEYATSVLSASLVLVLFDKGYLVLV